MFVAYLAGSAGKVSIPDAAEVVPSGSDDHISFLDAQGGTLVTFGRQDLSIYSKDADPIGDLMAHDGLNARSQS
jgi:hypothetical protein